MIKKMGNLLTKRIMRVRIQGPLDLHHQNRILSELERVRHKKANALIVIINSYGGSIRIAKNISDTIQSLKRNNIPCYCFAEEFCLNSANAILTAGSQCFASKLSVIGDFGFSYYRYSLDPSHPYLAIQTFPQNKASIQSIGNNYQLTQDAQIASLIQKQTEQLKNIVLSNRSSSLSKNNIKTEQFSAKIMQGGQLSPKDAVQGGLLDGLMTENRFIHERFADWRVINSKEQHRYKAISLMRAALDMFRQQ